jgi:hypothetical protein
MAGTGARARFEVVQPGAGHGHVLGRDGGALRSVAAVAMAAAVSRHLVGIRGF